MDITNWIVENPTIITALGTIAVAIATIYYAYTNHKLWLHTEKETIKPNKIDEMCFIIKPFIEHCEKGISSLKSKESIWDTGENKLYIDKFSYHPSVEIVYSNFIKGRLLLKKDLEFHDIKIESLNEKYKQLVEEIKSHNFQDFIEKSYNEFETTKESKNRQQLVLKELPRIIMHYILNEIDTEKNQLGDVLKTYWKRYGKEFLEMKNSVKANTIQKEINNIKLELIKILNEIKNKLEDILTDYVNTYGISLEDIESKDMPKDEKKKYIWRT